MHLLPLSHHDLLMPVSLTGPHMTAHSPVSISSQSLTRHHLVTEGTRTRARRVGQWLGPANVFQRLQNLEINRFWSLGRLGSLTVLSDVDILSEFVCPGEGLLYLNIVVVVTVVEVLLVGKVAELVSRPHLELIVLHRGQHQCAVLKYDTGFSGAKLHC